MAPVAAEGAPAIETHELSKHFGKVPAVDGIDLSVPVGSVFGFLGPNGSGKTTTIRVLLGLISPTTGSWRLFGQAMPQASAKVLPRVGALIEGPAFYPWLTGRQNLARYDAAGPDGQATTRRQRIDEALTRVGLSAAAAKKFKAYSLGMRQRLGLAAALLTRPRLLILDEPSNGLDPAGKKHVYGVLTRLAADGVTVVLSSHRMDDVESLCSEVTILATGRVAFSGPLTKLASESRELDYRILSSDPTAARRLAGETAGIRVLDESGGPQGVEALVVSGPVAALDELVKRLVHAGIAVRELAPVVSPLEAAFLALTQPPESSR
jgi:ABC-2 type transport system ATP-binding protein